MRLVRLASIVTWLTILPSAAFAQASITGVVRDTSGAVLPGVTVEAASPALIEKVRSVISDGTGQYRIEDLRPGTYTVTFTLPGFATVRREGIELTGTFTASINVELRVGAIEEAITVTGETPIVDVQSTVRERVLDQEVLAALPTNRSIAVIAGLMPGVTTANQDVGGIRGMGPANAGPGATAVHGVSDTRVVINGVSVHSVGTADPGDQGATNPAAYVEVVVDTGGVGAEQKEGGVRTQLVPHDGGNTFSGYSLFAFANDSMGTSNFTQDLKDRGLSTPNHLKKIWDINPALGGPIAKDKLWFYLTPRYTGALSYRALFANKNAGNPNAWTYEPDTSQPEVTTNVWLTGNARLTWQATPRNKLGVTYYQARSNEHPRDPGASTLTESGLNQWSQIDPKRLINYDWNSPVTNRLLVEVALVHHVLRGSRVVENVMFTNPSYPWVSGLINPVTEQSTGLNYRGTSQVQNSWNQSVFWRAAVSYITGAHAFKVGFNYGKGIADQLMYALDSPMSFRFNNGVPNQLTLRALPWRIIVNMDADHGLYVQDKWTVQRFTLTGGLRYDYFHDSFPDTTVGPGSFAPTRNIVFPAADGVRWHDLEPRSGLAVDVFGNGKTAAKISLNKYLAVQPLTSANTPFGDGLAPAGRIVATVNRAWTDSNRNFVPDCDLVNPAANRECGAMTDPNFGGTRVDTVFDPATLSGWGRRYANWQFGAGVQHQLMPRVSVDVGYYRTWFENFLATDSRAVNPSDFDVFSITAPIDPRLPGGGGYAVSGLYDLKPAAFGRAADKYLTFADNYGKQISHVDGFDVSVNARPRSGVLVQGGMNFQRRITDNCEIVEQLPEILFEAQNLTEANTNAWLPGSSCHQQSPFRRQLKFIATYTVPRIDVQVSTSVQNLPGPQIWANYTATNAVVAPSLGRSLSGASNIVVNIVQPGAIYGDRLNQIDLRFGKILKFGRNRVNAGFDVYNILNTNPVVRYTNAYATWQRPQEILTPRFAKVVFQFDF